MVHSATQWQQEGAPEVGFSAESCSRHCAPCLGCSELYRTHWCAAELGVQVTVVCGSVAEWQVVSGWLAGASVCAARLVIACGLRLG